MHVMHIVGSFGPGGAEMGIVRLIKGMKDLPVKHSVCSLSSDLTMKSHLPDTICCHSLEIEGPSFSAFKKLASLFRKTGVDIVHVNNIAPWFDAALASKLAGCRCIQTFHGVEDITMKFSTIKKIQFFLSWKLSHGLTAVSSMAAELFAQLTGIDASHITIIDNGIDTKFFSPPSGPEEKKKLRQSLGLPEKPVLIGCVAALRPVKNHAGLIAAFKSVLKQVKTPAVLVLVGDGPLKSELQDMCVQYGILEHVIFAGRRDNVEQYLKSFDVFALNSKTEGLSYAVLEAMACGLPVVASRVGGNDLVIDNGKHGFLYQEGDKGKLSQILIHMAESSDDRIRMGDMARHRILNHYSMESMVSRYFTLYSELCGNTDCVR